MTPYYLDSLVTLLQGDIRDVLAALPEGSVHAVVTSPPYWALRDYKVDGQIGMEPTIEEYVAHMVEVFRGVRRVLRDDGLLFLNLGDSYYGGNRKTDKPQTFSNGDAHGLPMQMRPSRNGSEPGLKDTDLCNIPHRIAQALQADGWYWRQTWHWIKRSPMPESVSGTRWERHRAKVAASARGNGYHAAATPEQPQGAREGAEFAGHANEYSPCPGCPRCTYPERPERNGWVLRRGSWRYTDAVEYVFLLAKRPGYTAFQEQVREGTAPESLARYERGSTYDGSRPYGMANPPAGNLAGRNPRNWALLSSEPQSVAHFATYPTALVEPFIRAATSDKGVCATCGAQWVPVVESPTGGSIGQSWHDHSDDNGQGQAQKHAGEALYKTYKPSNVLDYWPSCACPAAPPVPATVLDPFSGSGTTCLAARTLGRRSIGIDLSSDYMDIAVTRLGDARQAQMEMSL